MSPQDNTVQKIKRLLKLGLSSNEAEAKLAMARAQELMVKHNLDIAVVQDTPEAQRAEKREKVTIDRTAKYKGDYVLDKA